MSRYFINLLLLFLVTGAYSQNQATAGEKNDSISYKQEYGIRFGVDLSRPVLGFAIDDYRGLELVGDYRFTEKWWLAAEIGNEERTQTEDFENIEVYNYTSSGSYIKLGADYNTYQNWYGMNNSITIGGRYALASFSQTLNEFSFFQSDRFFSPDGFVPGNTEPQEFSGRTASWLEFVLGLKAELFANIYVGMSVRLAHLITQSQEDLDLFPNLWIPGFNRVNDSAKWGVGYNYSISYFLPLYKKAKKKRKKTPEPQEN